MWHPPGIVLSTRTLWQPTIASSSSGPRTARRTSRTAPRWSEPRSRASMAGMPRQCGLYERAIAAARANGFVPTTRHSRASLPRVSMQRALRGHRASLPAKARNGYLLWGAEGKVRRSINFIRISGSSRRPARGAPSGCPSSTSTSRRSSGFGGGVGRNRVGKLIDTLLAPPSSTRRRTRATRFWHAVTSSRSSGGEHDGHTMTVSCASASRRLRAPESVVHYAARTQESVIWTTRLPRARSRRRIHS